jgi:Tfp pilus assembly protein PilX
MRPMWWVVAVVALVVVVATYLTWLAARVDRLHERAASAGKALDAHLVRRAAAAAVLAEERLLPDLYTAARAALDAGPEEREAAENDLTRRLRGLALAADDAALLPVVAASRRVALARQVHTDLVRDARSLRARPVVRLAGLARGHPRPAYFDVGDPTLEASRPSQETV